MSQQRYSSNTFSCTFANLHSLMATSHCPEAMCWCRRIGKGLRLRTRYNSLIKKSKCSYPFINEFTWLISELHHFFSECIDCQ